MPSTGAILHNTGEPPFFTPILFQMRECSLRVSPAWVACTHPYALAYIQDLAKEGCGTFLSENSFSHDCRRVR